ncbi:MULTISPECIES: Zn-ribbon domain-containing OB-fold protein [unclassified Pigmentiphaga]|uniref:Zn-ribbon domain-containing OB-fold protein n=1 Tax=unclassified Pigmentiphaga TaxID=2626614 RepID=UPI000B41FA82|nr:MULTISPECIES: OB-fold domain-containing protein [unclassified Pigmentiphaga]OVZ65602.1 hypothetical protein CDO46_05160 [Pigmentiphaga sp. NML030171]
MSGPPISHRSWTSGHPALCFQTCPVCGHAWYFQRPFCPACGDLAPESKVASGHGRLYALTTVERAPGESWQSMAPYNIVLVDADEGFRVMGHGAMGLRIGDRVTVGFITHENQMLPFFEASSLPAKKETT